MSIVALHVVLFLMLPTEKFVKIIVERDKFPPEIVIPVELPPPPPQDLAKHEAGGPKSSSESRQETAKQPQGVDAIAPSIPIPAPEVVIPAEPVWRPASAPIDRPPLEPETRSANPGRSKVSIYVPGRGPGNDAPGRGGTRSGTGTGADAEAPIPMTNSVDATRVAADQPRQRSLSSVLGWLESKSLDFDRTRQRLLPVSDLPPDVRRFAVLVAFEVRADGRVSNLRLTSDYPVLSDALRREIEAKVFESIVDAPVLKVKYEYSFSVMR